MSHKENDKVIEQLAEVYKELGGDLDKFYEENDKTLSKTEMIFALKRAITSLE